MTDSHKSANLALSGVFSLSIGTFMVQSLSASGQFVLALWLAPEEFGYWAAAVSAMTVLTALTNFGEVNGYLAGLSTSLKRTRRVAFVANVGLAVLGFGIAFLYLATGRETVAVYCLIIAATIPLKGDSDVKIAAALSLKRLRLIVRAQSVAAVCKFGLSVIIAISFKSAVALALSSVVYYLAVELFLSKIAYEAQHEETHSEFSPTKDPPFKSRVSWALNSYFMTFPVQAIFLTAQFVLSPADLGLLYIGFQITLTLSGLLASPLNRVVLSTLRGTPKVQHGELVVRLGSIVSAAVAGACAVLGLALVWFSGFLPNAWGPAIPLALALLVSVPTRILTPVVEAYQQARNRWLQASSYSAIDAIGSAAAILVANAYFSIMEVALAITIWKVLFGVVRTLGVLSQETVSLRVALVFSAIGGSLLLLGGVWASGVYIGTASAVCVGGLCYFWRQRRPKGSRTNL